MFAGGIFRFLKSTRKLQEISNYTKGRMFKPNHLPNRFYHLTGQAWSQSYSFLNKDLVAHFEERGVKDEECNEFFQNCLKSDKTKFILFHSGKVLLEKESLKVSFINSETLLNLNLNFREAKDVEGPYSPIVFLGTHKTDKEAQYFSVAVDAIEKENILENVVNSDWFKPRTLLVSDIANPDELSVVGQAASRMNWIRNNKFSPKDSTVLIPSALGHRLVSTKGNKVYPNVNPVAICLVLNKKGDKILLGERTPLKGSGFFTCIAGFVEQGESVEDAAEREIFEESGVKVDSESITIIGSQSWPIGTGGNCELMIGCFAEAVTEEINFAPEEMSRMEWFTKEEATKMVENSLSRKRDMWKSTEDYLEDISKYAVPPQTAIAHHLIKAWVGGHYEEKKTKKKKISTGLAVAIGTFIGVVGTFVSSSL